MITIAPTIMAANRADYNQFWAVYKPFAERIQVDICDGILTPTRTLDLNQAAAPSDFQGKVDFHMMVKHPSQYLPQLIAFHPNLVIFHAECDENLLPVFSQLSSNNIKCGVALLKGTYPGDVREYIQAADHVLIFAGVLGQMGGKADLLQLEKTKIIDSIDSKIEIGWDGGANMDNIRAIAHSGIDVVNVGSAISTSPDPAQAYKDLEVEADKIGVNA